MQIGAIVVVAIIVVAAAAVALTRGGDDGRGNDPGTDSDHSVTITTYVDYNGNTAEITFDEIPERVVVGCNTALNLLLYLGLGDRIVGAYYDEEEVWDEVADEYDALCERIGDVDESGSRHISGNIQQDVLLSWEPDLVIGWVAWTDDNLGTEEFWNANGCNVMSLNSMTSPDARTTDTMKSDYENIGKIFDIEDEAMSVYDSIMDVVAQVDAVMEGKDTLTYAILDGGINSSNTIWPYGDDNFIASVLNDMGLTNAFPDASGRVGLDVAYETVSTVGIDLIIFIDYGSVETQNSYESIASDPVLGQCDAVKNGNWMGMKLSVSYGSTPELLDTLNEVSAFVQRMYA